MTTNFEKLIHGYMNPPERGSVVNLPNYLFSQKSWRCVKLAYPIRREPGSKNMLLFSRSDEDDVSLALYVNVLTFVNSEGMWLERNENEQDELSVPFFENGMNDALYKKNMLIVGGRRLMCSKTINKPPAIANRIYPMGYNNEQSLEVINGLGGMPAISKK